MAAVSSQTFSQEMRQQANAALMKLDKGLRSKEVGEQSESIIRFGRLFDRFPFAIVINAAFLKLSDVFLEGNNFLRLCVLRVVQDSQAHLEKILNVDEFMKRIFSVIHSNDPIARSLTLRMFGSLAPIVAERKNVHHSVRTGLESHDKLEQEAAIFAAVKLSNISGLFAAGICNKVAEMIQGLVTPVPVKLKLLRIFEHMHHDIETSSKVRILCSELLSFYPAESFVIITLQTLTKLAQVTVLETQPQIELLLNYLENDPRLTIKTEALHNLDSLAVKSAHIFDEHHIERLWTFTKQCEEDNVKISALVLLNTLAYSFAIVDMQHQDLLPGCFALCYDLNPSVGALACGVAAAIVANLDQSDCDSDCMEEMCLAIEACLMACAHFSNASEMDSKIKLVLSSLVRIARKDPSTVSHFSEIIVSMLSADNVPLSVLLCKCLITLTSCNAFDVKAIVSREGLLRLLERSTSSELLRSVSSLLFHLNQGLYTSESRQKFRQSISSQLESKLAQADGWTAYTVAQKAAQEGYHSIAAPIFADLATKVASEQFVYWLQALSQLSLAESAFAQCTDVPKLRQILPDVVLNYRLAATKLKNASSSVRHMKFQCAYCNLRARLLNAHLQFHTSCVSFFTSPPPALAQGSASASPNFVSQMTANAVEFNQIALEYGQLYESLFDANQDTLTNVLTLQHSCVVMAKIIETLVPKETSVLSPSPFGFLGAAFDFSQDGSSTAVAASSLLLKSCKQIAKKTQADLPRLHALGLSAKLVEFLCEASRHFLLTPLCFPPYFFQSRQVTSITLALTPTPNSETNIADVPSNVDMFTLGVEGVIQHKGTEGYYRQPASVHLSVKATCHDRRSPPADPFTGKVVAEWGPESLQRLVRPKNNYFTALFLLRLPYSGRYDVSVEANLVDETGRQWTTGPRISLDVLKDPPLSVRSSTRRQEKTNF
ncbi:integrator complex subunit 7-like [Oscarella lobularis]|uniref:integrator complex subunit 7-like n=1 Tax=Oscarella lobularis TaxID=121494 RepID=UPI0033142416